MPVDDEVLVGRLLVLAHAELEQRRSLQTREAISDVVTRDLQGFGTGDSGLGRRIDDRSPGVVRDLEAAPLVPGNPVHEARAVVRPDRERFFRKAPVARRRAEEKHFLTGRTHALADHVGKQRAEPGTAGEDEVVGRQVTVVGQLDLRELASPWHNGPLPGELAVLATLGDERLEHGGTGAARGEIAGIFFENGPAHLLAVDLGITSRDLGPLQLLEVYPRIAQDRQCRLLVLLVALDEPQDTDVVIELSLPALLVFLPEGQRTHGHVRVHGARGLRSANDARFSATAVGRV